MAEDSGAEGIDEVTLEPTGTVVRKSRPRALWGVLAVAVVAAGALAVVSGGDDGGPSRLPVALRATAAQESDAAAADAMLAWVVYRPGDGLPDMGGSAPAYRLAGGISEAEVAALGEALGIDGTVTGQDGFWQVSSSDGRYLEVFDDTGSPWWYSSDIDFGGNAGGGASGEDVAFPCGEPATLCVSPTEDPCPPGAMCEVEAVECAPGTDCRVDRPEPRTPVDLPSEDEARRIALEFLTRAGVDVDDAVVRVDGPYDAWHVTVEPRVDGVAAPGISATASVGSEGVVTSASGHLGTPERLDDYPLISALAAIDRLNSQLGGDFGVDMPASSGAGDTASTLHLPCEEATDGGEICVGTGGDPGHTEPGAGRIDTCIVDPVPDPDGDDEGTTTGADLGAGTCEVVPPDVDPCYQAVPPQGDQGQRTEPDGGCGTRLPLPDPMPLPEPEPLEVVLTDVEPVLLLLPSEDGTGDAYLVPGYRLSNADGHQVDVVAVADDSLSPPGTATTVPDTAIARPAPIDPPDGPTTPSCAPLVEQDNTGTTHTILPCQEIPPAGPDPVHLEPGTEPAVGVGYYVDLDLQCPVVILGSTIWVPDTRIDWAERDVTHEGGTFTIKDEGSAHFQGDAAATKQAVFRPVGPAEDPCVPRPRP